MDSDRKEDIEHSGVESDLRYVDWMELSEGEVVEWWSHPSILPYLPLMALSVVIAVLGLILPAIAYGTVKWYPLFLVPIGLLLLGWEYLSYSNVFYVITNQKLVLKSGIISRDQLKVHFDEIKHTTLSRSVTERIFGYGDIQIATAGTAFTEMQFSNVPKPRTASSLIEEGRSEGYIGQKKKNV